MQIKEQQTTNDYKAHKNYAEQQSKWARISNYQLWTMSNEATKFSGGRQTATQQARKPETRLWAVGANVFYEVRVYAGRGWET